ncbi:MAG: metallophosphoesterase [Phascolarctobacterium sp.]|nr:metallophosphoesterase [Phascolarctobacterium sp.]
MRIYFVIIGIEILLCFICYLFFRQNFEFAKSTKFLLVYVLLAANTIAVRFLPETMSPFIVRNLAWLNGFWLSWAFYLLLAAIIMLILRGIDHFTNINLPLSLIASGLLIFSFLFTSWGAYRAMHQDIRTEKIVTEKLPAGEKHKIVFITDLHLGQMLGRDYAKGLVAKVNALKPDFILIGGDLLDERISHVNREDSLTPLKNFQANVGVYMCYGNHDYLDRPELWQKMVEEQGIHILRDQDVKLDKLKITGLNDFSRNRTNDSLIALSKENKDFYSILLDHQPRKMEIASEVGYDLYLAGHTHTGQLWPFRMVTQKLYKLDYGRKSFGDLVAITSNGYGFWGRPVRTEVAPEYIVIELEGK